MVIQYLSDQRGQPNQLREGHGSSDPLYSGTNMAQVAPAYIRHIVTVKTKGQVKGNSLLTSYVECMMDTERTTMVQIRPWLQTTQPTSGGAVTEDSSCCAKLCRTSHRFFAPTGHADTLDGWRCCSQKRVMSRPFPV